MLWPPLWACYGTPTLWALEGLLFEYACSHTQQHESNPFCIFKSVWTTGIILHSPFFPKMLALVPTSVFVFVLLVEFYRELPKVAPEIPVQAHVISNSTKQSVPRWAKYSILIWRAFQAVLLTLCGSPLQNKEHALNTDLVKFVWPEGIWAVPFVCSQSQNHRVSLLGFSLLFLVGFFQWYWLSLTWIQREVRKTSCVLMSINYLIKQVIL